MAANSESTGEKKVTKQRGKGRPFEKGKSGNPSGRPKVPEELKVKIRDACPAAVDALISIATSAKAKDSDRIKASEILLDRGYGKAVQAVDLDAEISNVPVVIDFKGKLDEWSK